MKILVTGGAGFIGSHLGERLTAQGHAVDVVDPRYDTTDNRTRGITTTCQTACVHKIPAGRWDFVYHLAATVGVKRVLENPSECISNNLDALRAVLALGVPGIFTSTSEVYGKTTGPLSEDSELKYSSASRWAYAQSKIIGEHLALQAGWKVVRLFNVVGPRQNEAYGAVMPRFVRQALDGKALTVYGDGSQIRTFLDVRDCVEILDRLREKDFKVVNVGGKTSMSIRALAAFVVRQLGGNGFVTRPYSEVYPEGFEECKERIPDLRQLRSLIPDFEYRNLPESIQALADSLQGEKQYESVGR